MSTDNWKGIDKLPAYNPFMFEIARHFRGYGTKEVTTSVNITIKRISDIEKGNCTPTEIEVETLSNYYDFPKPFFEQWWDTQIDITPNLVKNVPIDYAKYKIFRELNPNFVRMQPHFPQEIKLAKVIDIKR